MNLKSIVLALCLLVVSAPLVAANRAFVSGNGMDTGTCLITAPCRSFAYALTQITSGGEIIAVDTAGYGAATISMGVSIIGAPGVTAFSTNSSGFVLVVAVGSTDVVTLRGITVSGTGTTTGIAFNSGQSLNVENCIIKDHTFGIQFDRSADSGKPGLQVLNTVFRHNTIGLDISNSTTVVSGNGGRIGALAVAPPPALIYATVKDSAFFSNAVGLDAHDDTVVGVDNSVFAGNTVSGVAALGSDGNASAVALERCTISRNATGVVVGDSSGGQVVHGIVRLAYCLITGNDTSISTTSTGSSLSLVSNGVLTNIIEANGIDNAPTSSFFAK